MFTLRFLWIGEERKYDAFGVTIVYMERRARGREVAAEAQQRV